MLLLLGLGWYLYRKIRQRRLAKTPQQHDTLEKNNATFSEDAYYQIEPLADFNLEGTEPLKIRPFKPKYHLTMALENTTISDLVAMDNTYLTRIQLRSQLIKDRPSDVLAANPIVGPSVHEFYTWMTSTYLPRRFPTIFKLLQSPGPSPRSSLQNLVTNEMLPTFALSTEEALRLLGSNVDDDFLFLLPSSDPADEGKYRLEGFVTCFPSGFNTPKKLNLKLADIHGPVPGYRAKIEKSMDRFFASLPVGKIVQRVNWSVTTNTDLFCLAGNHLTEEQANERKDAELEQTDIEKTVLRCERQTLHRLPLTKALVFAFKTYQYPIKMLKDEGSAEELAQAIDGLGLGSVPGMTVYKRQVIWGKKVKEYLRS
ncbi:hypothetical protein K469DRAFT_720026 [Zopfia rhizophila CBS 207.26]|uniref:HRQ family protein 2 n=1 Tax=Zopfia rhizophila CBS 207.26 TaxID=1314779 RepID=A0A6A6EH77_9PEZI|nr:hypothetical protein K469DRAFT_720026 [Zopfia rhizophila CBS 207.26]